jgi:tetratricopeptide (TPR) repeat protein
MGNHDWRFVESDYIGELTLEFDKIRESTSDRKVFSKGFRNLLKTFPYHIDILHHYSICKAGEGKLLEALMLVEVAVSTGKKAFPINFELGKDTLDTGWVQNRPFLRALHHLMLLQWDMFCQDKAITTGEECLALDPSDRMGARLSLVEYYISEKRYLHAINLFEDSRFNDTFSAMEYLHPLALFALNRKDEASVKLNGCLIHYPKVVKYIVEKDLPIPENNSPFGITSGSEFEGYYYARQFGYEWTYGVPGALEWLRQSYYANIAEKPTNGTQS